MTTAIVVTAAFGLGGVVGAFALLAGNRAADDGAAASPRSPVWTEVQWPFPIDQWGKGKAFRCKAADCGAEVKLYLRALSSAPAIARWAWRTTRSSIA
jgi:hypothetical protein